MLQVLTLSVSIFSITSFLGEGVENFGNERSQCVTLGESEEEILSTGLGQNTVVALLDKQGKVPRQMKIKESDLPHLVFWQVFEIADNAVTLGLGQLLWHGL